MMIYLMATTGLHRENHSCLVKFMVLYNFHPSQYSKLFRAQTDLSESYCAHCLLLQEKVKLAVATSVLQATRNSVFPSIHVQSMEHHVLDNDFRDDQNIIVIKLIVNICFDYFFYTCLLVCMLRGF